LKRVESNKGPSTYVDRCSEIVINNDPACRYVGLR